MSVIEELTDYIVDLSFAKLPAEVIETTKKQILDTLGCAVAGTSHRAIEPVANLIKEWGGKEESTIIGYGGRVPCTNAALVNGYLAGVTDFDDYNDTDFPHVSRQNVPACFAMAERIGNIGGRDFLVAVAMGYDITCRLSRAVSLHFEAGSLWEPSTLFSFFGCSAASGKLLGLKREPLRHIFGLALQQANGLMGGNHEGITSKGLNAGRAAAASILIALLAERGLTGVSDPFESKRGLYDAYYRSVYTPEMITVDLGKVFAAKTSAFKPYPCCGFNGTATDATLALVKEYGIKPENIAEINIQSGRHGYRHFEPRAQKIKPASAIASQFSLPWAVANAAVHGKLGLEHFTAEAIQDNKTLEMAEKITFKLNPEFNTCEDFEPALVVIKTREGKTYSRLADVRYGHWKNPMDWKAIVEKFIYCCSFTTRPIPTKKRDQVIKMVDSLEGVTDVSEIIRLLG